MSEDLWDGAEAVTGTEAVRRLEAALREAQAREAALTKALRDTAGSTKDGAPVAGGVRPCWCDEPDHRCRDKFWCVQARAALASQSAAAAEMLRRVESLEADAAGWPQSGIQVVKTVLYHIGGEVEGKPTQTINYLQRLQALVAAEADRDRWLGHVRALVAKVDEVCSDLQFKSVFVNAFIHGQNYTGAQFGAEVEAARRDLKQHDGTRKGEK